jgi:hypothetical protein
MWTATTYRDYWLNNRLNIISFLVHTMDELKLTGNCLKGSRPLLSFDKVRLGSSLHFVQSASKI